MTTEQKAACLAVARIILETVQEAGEAGVPSGHIYAALMGKLSLDQYEAFIRILVDAGKITNKGHLLKAI